MSRRYYLTLPDPAKARGTQPGLEFRAHGADAFAEELQDALHVLRHQHLDRLADQRAVRTTRSPGD